MSDKEFCDGIEDGSLEKFGEYGGIACMRLSGHRPPHVGMVRNAALLDGTCYACRQPLQEEHAADCWATAPKPTLQEAEALSLRLGIVALFEEINNRSSDPRVK